jgi:hypothetical protein
MPDQVNKEQLLNDVRSKQAELEGILAQLSETQMTAPGVNEEWSLKDILAHLNSRQQRTLLNLHAAVHYEQPTVELIESEEAMNALNARFFENGKTLPLATVLADFRSLHRQMLEIVPTLSEEDLSDDQKFSWTGGEPLWYLVAGNTYGHIEEHLGDIQSWLANQS